MDRRQSPIIFIGVGCLVLFVLAVVAGLGLFLILPGQFYTEGVVIEEERAMTVEPGAQATQVIVPTWTPLPEGATPPAADVPSLPEDNLIRLYEQLNPGVVNIGVFLPNGQSGAGSGFILDDEGHIVTNNHVVVGAEEVTVIFYDGFETNAEIVGMDPDSDLAIIRVDEMAEGAHPLPLGDSDDVRVGEWVVAIGNPFGLGSSMSLGIVSALGRMIASGATQYNIPLVIQTDAAINPGNSGGPLINMKGEVIGVNAQIATTGFRANAGVGFAIPSRVVRKVAPVLIETGVYRWPWLGISGTSVNLLLVEANDLESQYGAYIDAVEPGAPADEAGLQGSTGAETIQGIPVSTGGDVVVGANGEPVRDFQDLLAYVMLSDLGDTLNLTILRNGREIEIPVTLDARPPDEEF